MGADTGRVRADGPLGDDVDGLRRRVLELEEELEEARRLARVGTNMMGLAHSIRSTLGICRAATYMVDRALTTWDKPGLERAWSMVERSHARITEMVSGLLDPEAALRLDAVPANPNTVAREVGQVAAEEAADQGDELRLELGEGLDGVVFDRQAFHSCCVELLANSLDALVETPNRGSITLRTEREASGWTLRVIDTGLGMTDEQLELALRGGFSSKGKGGSGLGLAQVCELVRRHGGTVTVTTEPGVGTEVCCWFPLAPPALETCSDEAAEDSDGEEI